MGFLRRRKRSKENKQLSGSATQCYVLLGLCSLLNLSSGTPGMAHQGTHPNCPGSSPQGNLGSFLLTRSILLHVSRLDTKLRRWSTDAQQASLPTRISMSALRISYVPGQPAPRLPHSKQGIWRCSLSQRPVARPPSRALR